MKIEMGESLMYSWLRHVKICQVVQTNWKVSPSWTLSNKEMLINIMDNVSDFYKDKYDMDIFKKSSFEQLIRQAETDVIGISYNPEPFIYGIDVAFHENGLMYGNKFKTSADIIKKYVRTLMCIIGYMNFFEGEIIFATPNANNSILQELLPKLDDLRNILASMNINFNIKFFYNDGFYKSILSPIMIQSTGISDTSELFMRSYQMIKLFDGNKSNHITSSKTTEAYNDYMSISAFDELKIGKLVQITIPYMFEKELMSQSMIDSLCDKAHSKKLFGINFSVLKDITDCNNKDSMRMDSKGNYRYYSTPIKHHGKTYLLCQEWNERLHRKNYDIWYKSIIDIQ